MVSESELELNHPNIVEAVNVNVNLLPETSKKKNETAYKLFTNWRKVAESLVCNHARAYYLFAESIRNKCAFPSKRCNSVEDAIHSRCYQNSDVYMGQVETYRFGLYYVKTKDKPPYSLSEI